MSTPSAEETARRYFPAWRVAEILRSARTGSYAALLHSLKQSQFGAAGGDWWVRTGPKGVTASYSIDGPEVLHAWVDLFAAVTARAKAHPDAAAALEQACHDHTLATRAYMYATSEAGTSIGRPISPAEQAAADAQQAAADVVRTAYAEFWRADAEPLGQLDLFAEAVTP